MIATSRTPTTTDLFVIYLPSNPEGLCVKSPSSVVDRAG
jgi:hypothetical protein